MLLPSLDVCMLHYQLSLLYTKKRRLVFFRRSWKHRCILFIIIATNDFAKNFGCDSFVYKLYYPLFYYCESTTLQCNFPALLMWFYANSFFTSMRRIFVIPAARFHCDPKRVESNPKGKKTLAENFISWINLRVVLELCLRGICPILPGKLYVWAINCGFCDIWKALCPKTSDPVILSSNFSHFVRTSNCIPEECCVPMVTLTTTSCSSKRISIVNPAAGIRKS